MVDAKTTKKSYKDLIIGAITTLKERNGSSRQALKKYIQANGDVTTTNFDGQFNLAIKRGVAAGYFVQPKGPSGPIKLDKTHKIVTEVSKKPVSVKKAPSPKKSAPKKAPKKVAGTKAATVKKVAPKKVTSKKTAPKKETAAKKSVKKVAPKKTTTKKVAPKKTTTTAKAVPKKRSASKKK